MRAELGRDARHYNFNAYADKRAVFRYDMHTLPTEIAASIGTSTLFAAWNAAVYVAQIDDERLAAELGARQLSRRHARGAADARQPVVPRRILRRFPQARLKHAASPTDASTRAAAAPHPPDIAAAAAELVACGSLEMGADTPEDARASPSCCPPARRSTSTTCRATSSPTRCTR